jgi:hypothetical protein
MYKYIIRRLRDYHFYKWISTKDIYHLEWYHEYSDWYHFINKD